MKALLLVASESRALGRACDEKRAEVRRSAWLGRRRSAERSTERRPVQELAGIKDQAKGLMKEAADTRQRDAATLLYHVAVAAAFVHHGARDLGPPHAQAAGALRTVRRRRGRTIRSAGCFDEAARRVPGTQHARMTLVGRHPPRALRNRRAARQRRHGRGVSRARSPAQSIGRDQDRDRRRRCQRRAARAVRSRGPGRRAARSPQRLPRVRRRPRSRSRLPRHGVSRRRNARQPHGPRTRFPSTTRSTSPARSPTASPTSISMGSCIATSSPAT